MSAGMLVAHVVHYKRIALAGVVLGIASFITLALISGHASLLEVEILTACIGIGTGATFPVATVSVQNAVDRMHLGVATGVLTFLRTLGGALGVAVLGAVALGYGMPLGREGAQSAIDAASADAFVMMFFVCAAMMGLALVTFALMPEKPLRGGDIKPALE